MTYAVIYERTGNGYSAYVPDLPGCVAAGAKMHLEAMREDGDSIPEPTTVAGSIAILV
jgi:predicted RNase H-like HicB family nuclease